MTVRSLYNLNLAGRREANCRGSVTIGFRLAWSRRGSVHVRKTQIYWRFPNVLPRIGNRIIYRSAADPEQIRRRSAAKFSFGGLLVVPTVPKNPHSVLSKSLWRHKNYYHPDPVKYLWRNLWSNRLLKIFEIEVQHFYYWKIWTYRNVDLTQLSKLCYMCVLPNRSLKANRLF